MKLEEVVLCVATISVKLASSSLSLQMIIQSRYGTAYKQKVCIHVTFPLEYAPSAGLCGKTYAAIWLPSIGETNRLFSIKGSWTQ